MSDVDELIARIDAQQQSIAKLLDMNADVMEHRQVLLSALQNAIRIAEEARLEWDRAPSGMRAGKILIALSGGCPGYRQDIDAIHAAVRNAKVTKP